MSARWIGMLLAGTIALPGAAQPLQPFEARYEVWLDGKHRGESTMQLRQLDDGIWEHRVDVAGTSGLARLAAAEATQSSRFRLVGGAPRLLEASTSSEALMRQRRIRTVFDWDAGVARWDGDVKPDQAGPLPLQTGASNGPLLNLALALKVSDTAPGDVLSYPLFERGRITRQDYRTGAPEAVRVPAGEFVAVPMVTRRESRQRTTTLWFALDLPPTPVRMQQIENGAVKYELRLIEVR